MHLEIGQIVIIFIANAVVLMRFYTMKTLLIIMLMASPMILLSQPEDDRIFMQQLNALRTEAGLQEIPWNPTLDSILDVWTEQMLEALDQYSLEEIKMEFQRDEGFIHINLEKRRKSVSYDKDSKFHGLKISENAILSVGGPYDDPAMESFDAWKASMPHHKLMIAEDAQSFAFGYKCDEKRGRSIYLLLITRKVKI